MTNSIKQSLLGTLAASVLLIAGCASSSDSNTPPGATEDTVVNTFYSQANCETELETTEKSTEQSNDDYEYACVQNGDNWDLQRTPGFIDLPVDGS